MFTQISQLSTAELAGVAGFLLYVFNYSMLSLRRISGDCIGYFILNAVAASLVLVGLTASFNLASALTQVFWITISAMGIALRLYRAHRLNYATLETTEHGAAITTLAQPDARFRSVRRWADASQETGSPDRVSA